AVESAVEGIIEQVRVGGTAAIADLTERYDGVRPVKLLLRGADISAAADGVAPELAKAIDLAIARVRSFYSAQPTPGFEFSDGGARLGMLVRPLASVGCYVPGGTAPLFSSLIMTAVPARVAGVERLVVATPPTATGGLAREIA